jgi:hypothetical protein
MEAMHGADQPDIFLLLLTHNQLGDLMKIDFEALFE